MNQQTRDFIEWLRSRNQSALDQLGQFLKARTQDDLSVLFPPASSPGEQPHKRTGNLQNGVDYTLTVFNETATECKVISQRANGNPLVPIFLEFGTSHMLPRPYMTPRFDNLRITGLRKIADRFSQPNLPDSE